MAEPLGIIKPGQVERDQAAIVNAVLQTLGTRDDWLLVFDNAESPAELARFLPGGGGHVLITSRNPNWSRYASPFPLDVMQLETAKQLLMERSGQTDDAAAATIARQVGRLPLALEVAGAYCLETVTPLSDYATLLTDSGLTLHDDHQPIDYHSVISKTWQPSFDKAAEECPDAEELLSILSFMAPDDFPMRLLASVFEAPYKGRESFSHENQPHAQTGTSEKDSRPFPNQATTTEKDSRPFPPRLIKAVAALRKYSLIHRTDDLLSMHRLVQQVVRTTLVGWAPPTTTESTDNAADTAPPAALTTAITIINGGITGNPENDLDQWPIYEQLLPHALAATERCPGDPSRTTALVSRILGELAIYQKSRAQYAAAEPLYRYALAIDEQTYGREHPTVAIRLNNLAALLQATARWSEAEPLLRRALAIDEETHGQRHPKVATRLNNLAQLLADTNRSLEAEPLMQRALAIDERTYDGEHRIVAIRLSNLAALLLTTNRSSEAEPLMRRALAIDEEIYGPHHPKVGLRVTNLAILLEHTNRIHVAGPLYCLALDTFRRILGDDHPHTANVRGSYERWQQRVGQAEPDARPHGKPRPNPPPPLTLGDPISPWLDEALGSAGSVEDALKALDEQYKAEGRPDIYFLSLDEPISPHLDELLGPIEAESTQDDAETD